MRTTFFFFYLLLASPSFGQCFLQMEGKIMDSETHQPVASAEIILVEQNKISSSDSLGYFHFDALCNEDYQFIVQRIGYKTLQIQIHVIQDSTYLINLEFDPTLFPSVEIESQINPPPSAFHSTTIVKSIESNLQSGSLAERLKTVVGINRLNSGNNISKPVIHGLHSNRVLILNNGIRQEGQQWGNEHAPEIDPFVADKLTVVKGASGLQYGHDAIGGVILVEPKELNASPGIRGQLDLLASTNGRQGIASGSLEFCPIKLPRWSAGLQGTINKNGNIHTPHYTLRNTSKQELNFSSTVAYRQSHFTIELFYSQFNTDAAIFSGSHVGNLTDLEKALTDDAPHDSAGFSYSIDRPKQHIEHELTKVKMTAFHSEKIKCKITYARQYNLREEYDKHRPRNDSLAALNHPELKLEITTHTLDANWEIKQKKNFTFSSGVNTTYQANTYEGRYFIPNFIRKAGGLYLIEKLNKKTFNMEAGIRFDIQNLQIFRYNLNVLEQPSFLNRNVAANFGVRKEWNKRHTFLWNAATTWRAPQASELYSNGLHHGSASVEIGNTNLQTERVYSSSVEYVYSNDTYGCSVAPYVNQFTNFIYLSPQLPATLTIRGAFPTFVYRQDKVRMHGCDFDAFINLTKKNRLTGKASIVRARTLTTGDYLILMPSDKYELNFFHQFRDKKAFRKTTLSIGWVYVNKQWRVPPQSDYLSPPKAYFLFHIMAHSDLQFSGHTIQIGININNALDKSYRDYMNRFRYFSDEMGRNISIQVSIPISKQKQDE